MQKYQDFVLDSKGRAVSGASVTVTDSSGATATIYSDNGSTTQANPMTTGTDGGFAFYAADGRYNLSISGTGFTSKTVTDILLEDPADGSSALAVNPSQYGGVGDGSTDDTQAVQDCFDAARASGLTVDLLNKTWRCTSSLTVDGGINIIGRGVSPYSGTLGTRGSGSWLFFDHTGKGLVIDGGQSISGVYLDKFGTYRTQPAAGGGWAPTAHDWDIWIDQSDVLIGDITTLNPTKGVWAQCASGASSYSRLEIGRIRGQAFDCLLRVDSAFDVCKISNVHQWPFWADDSNIHAYTMTNLDVIHLERCDNPMFVNVFTIFARSSFRLGQSASGGTSKLKVANFDADLGIYGVWVDSTGDSTTAQFESFSHQGQTGESLSKAVFIEADNCRIDIGMLDSAYADQNTVRVDGTGNYVRIGQLTARNYNQAGAAYPAVEAATGNTVEIVGTPLVSGGGSGPNYGGAGTINAPDHWVEYTPTVSASSGTLTTVSALASYVVRGDTVELHYDITVSDAGTGSGTLSFTLPHDVTSNGTVQRFVGAGREIAVNGKQHSVTLAPGGSSADVLDYTNSSVIATSARIVGSVTYRKA